MSTRDPIDPEAFGGDEYRRDGDVTSTERDAQAALEASTPPSIDRRLSDRPVAPEDVAAVVALDATLKPLAPQDVDLGAEDAHINCVPWARYAAVVRELDALKRSAAPLPPARPVDADELKQSLKQEIMCDIAASLERVAPWLYEPPVAPLPFLCPWCNEKAVYLYGLRYKIGKVWMQRWRCTRCGGTSNTSLHVQPCGACGDGGER